MTDEIPYKQSNEEITENFDCELNNIIETLNTIEQINETDSTSKNIDKKNTEYVLTKNEYLINLYDDIFKRGFSSQSLLIYVIMSLPGLSMEERAKILFEGPELPKISVQSTIEQYVYSRLVQYKSTDEYKKTINKLPIKQNKVLCDCCKTKEVYTDLYHIEDVKNHTVTLTDEPSLI